MRMYRIAFSLAILVFSSSLFAEQDPRAVFEQAKKAYVENDYKTTIEVLRSFVKKNGTHQANEYLVPLLVEALIRENRLTYAERLLTIYGRKYPDSEFIPRMAYLEGVVLARKEEFPDAIGKFSEALRKGVPESLESLAVKNVETICKTALTSAELHKMAETPSLHKRVQEVLKYFAIEKSYAAGEVGRASRSAEEFRREFPRSPYSSAAKELADKARNRRSNQIQIGLLAPVSGYDGEIGKQIVRGAQAAIEQHNAGEGRPRVKIVITDTKGSAVETAHKTLSLLNEHGVSLVVGPVLSHNAAVTASICVGRDALMITPTATDDGIAELSPNAFQMNVPLGALGMRIARYAMENLNITEFAIMSPLSEYGMTLTRRFKEYVESHGGEVIAEEYFDEGANDFRPQFQSLRSRLILRRRERLAQVEGMDMTPNSGDLRSDSIRLEDSTLTVGGLFMPAAAEDVVMLAPQVYFHKIQTQMLGSTGWHTTKTILDGKRYVNNAIISTNLEMMVQNDRWKRFQANFKSRYNKDADRVAALGYDAAQLVLKALEQNGWDTNPKKVAQALRSMSVHQGISGRVSFDPKTGANSEAAIVKISNKEFVRLQ